MIGRYVSWAGRHGEIVAFVNPHTEIPEEWRSSSVRRGRHALTSSRARFVVQGRDDNGESILYYPETRVIHKHNPSPPMAGDIDWDNPPVVTKSEHNVDGASTVTANRPLTEQEMADLWGLDTNVWRATKIVTNTWARNFQTKVWWERDETNHAAGLLFEDLLESIRNEMQVYRDVPGVQIIRKLPEPDAPRGMGLIAIPDAHLGMMAWGAETGYENWDLKIVEDTYEDVLYGLLVSIGENDLDEIWFPVGNDFFHVDTLMDGKVNTTTRGTPQDHDGRWQKAFMMGQRILTDAINSMSAMAPVRVIVTPGNHDKAKAWMLGQVLEARFHGRPQVSFESSPLDRRYLTYGRNLLGFHHGDRVKDDKLYRWMSQEAPGWSEAVHREWILGDLHHDRIERIDNMGIRVRRLPTIIPPDAWHSENGFVGSSRAGKALLYSPHGGVIREYTEIVRPRTDT